MREGHSILIVPRIWPEHVTWRDKHEARPGIGIVWAETHGPLDQSFPSESQRRLFGENERIHLVEDKPIYIRHRRGVKSHVVESTAPRGDAARIIQEFIPRAFRRPVSDSEMQPFVQLTLARLDAGRTFEQAVRAGVTAVLCSPQFLLLNRSRTSTSSRWPRGSRTSFGPRSQMNVCCSWPAKENCRILPCGMPKWSE